ncbi:RNA polymerase [Rhizocola hellebori]|uniref:RNA polymerase n=1 Tax=Rhizocola hellebori TaxID=1392758 RepID=A0A8J3QKE6_9ACTN|nr:RNA polymerase [Rhizocola hellebori]
MSTWNFSENNTALKEVGASWYYNWSAAPASGVTGVEFVPMIWGAGSVTTSNLNRAKASGKVLLGFNEPDFASQSNLSVTQALDLWPQLQATGLRLGSPAVATGGATAGGWLDRFLTGARERGLRVDFITLHWYGSDFSTAAVNHLASYVRAVHDRYQLPIWVTEYALIKFGSGGSTYPSAAQQVAFVNGSTAMLSGLSYVERYAWFALPTPDEGGEGTGLFRKGVGLTAAGTAYRAAS